MDRRPIDPSDPSEPPAQRVRMTPFATQPNKLGRLRMVASQILNSGMALPVDVHAGLHATNRTVAGLALMGDQSAGKSALLTSLVGGVFQFPSDAGTCTKVPVRIHFSPEQCQPSIALYRGYDLAEVFIGDIDAVKAKFTEMTGRYNNDDVRYNNNTHLRLTLHVPGCKEMEVMDLPGWRADGEILVLNHFAQEAKGSDNTLIIQVIDAGSDVSTVRSCGVLLDAPPGRVFPVFTKIDKATRGDTGEIDRMNITINCS